MKSWYQERSATKRLQALQALVDTVSLEAVANDTVGETELLAAARALGYAVSRRGGGLWIHLKAPARDATWAARMKEAHR